MKPRLQRRGVPTRRKQRIGSTEPRIPNRVPGLHPFHDSHLMAVVDREWNPTLEAEWAPTLTDPWDDPRHGNRPNEARIVARIAVSTWFRQWRREYGPEWAASEGATFDEVIDAIGRAPRAMNESDICPPITPDDVREVLADGWLLKFWRRET